MNPSTPQRILVVTPTLGESHLLAESIEHVAALRVPIIHVLSAPESKVLTLRKRYPWTVVVADQGKAAGSVHLKCC